MSELDMKEQLARIDREQATIHELYSARALKIADEERRRQEIRFAPWYVIATIFGAVAAAFAAGHFFG